jgi:hypothetical protein
VAAPQTRASDGGCGVTAGETRACRPAPGHLVASICVSSPCGSALHPPPSPCGPVRRVEGHARAGHRQGRSARVANGTAVMVAAAPPAATSRRGVFCNAGATIAAQECEGRIGHGPRQGHVTDFEVERARQCP